MGNHRHSLVDDSAGDFGRKGSYRPSRLEKVAIEALIEAQEVGLS
jgi:hypothetical protein